MKKSKLLIVDDNPDIVLGLREALQDDFLILSAYSGGEALELAKVHKPDLVIIDFHMPNGDGHFFCSELRKSSELSSLPILVISGDTEISSKMKLYEVGADDYIAKPFSYPEIRAKIKVNLRRNSADLSKDNGDIEFDLQSQEIRFKGQTKKLSKVESKILDCLLRHNGSLVNRTELYNSVWTGQSVTARTVDVHIANLRKKLPALLTIESRYGLGYVLKERTQQSA